jgi:ribosomal protein L20
MPRVKRGTKRRAKRKKILDRASGYFLTKSNFDRGRNVRRDACRAFSLWGPLSNCREKQLQTLTSSLSLPN